MTQPVVRIGTRGSPLARWQAEWVAAQLGQRGATVELVPIVTQGDTQQQGPIGGIGTQGVFTKELQRALLDRRIDVAVHSLKDLPTDAVAGLILAAVPSRESTSDVLISRNGESFERLSQGARVGTGSLRRQALLLHARPDLQMADVRGNVDTRLRKLREGQYDALVLAEAGLRRLGLQDQITQTLAREMILPAVGQGALGLETRADDPPIQSLLAALDDRPSHQAVLAERSLLAALRGGCLAPVGAAAYHLGDRLRIDAVVLSRDGKRKIAASSEGQADDALAIGQQAAERLIAQGAFGLIQSARGER